MHIDRVVDFKLRFYASIEHRLGTMLNFRRGDDADILTSPKIHTSERNAQTCHLRIHFNRFDSLISGQTWYVVTSSTVLNNDVTILIPYSLVNFAQNVWVSCWFVCFSFSGMNMNYTCTFIPTLICRLSNFLGL